MFSVQIYQSFDPINPVKVKDSHLYGCLLISFNGSINLHPMKIFENSRHSINLNR